MKIKIFLAVLVFLFFNQLSLSQNHENLDVMIDSLFSEFNSENAPGASVMVIQNGNIIFDKSYGFANLEKEERADRNTNYRLASVTKQFTAASVLMLIDRKKLTLSTNLKDAFEDFPDYGRKITVYQLLTHTSGLIDYESLIPDTATEQVHDGDVLNMMMRIDSLYFEPGTKYKYSNTAYALLALIVEKMSGKSFAEFLKENIFDPLSMKSTVAHQEGRSTVKKRAFGYSKKDDGFFFDDQSLTSAVLGDGGIYSSAGDLFEWDQSLYFNNLISSKLRSQAFSHALLSNGEKINYGFGWHLEKRFDRDIIYHTGSTRGFRNVLYRIPSDELSVIILTNRNEGEPKKIAEKIIEYLLNNLGVR